MNLSPDELSRISDEVLFGRGYVLLKDWFDADSVTSALADTIRLHKAANGGVFSGGYRPDILFQLGLEEMMADPGLVAVGRSVLGDEPAYGSFGCNVVPPGSEGMALHLDYPYFAMTKLPARAKPALCMQLIWYACDVTDELAPTVVVPGTQTRPRFPRKTTKAERVLAPAGSVCVSHGALWHGVAPNTGSEDRPVLLGSYVPFWVQPMLSPSYQFGSDGLRRLLRSNMGERIGIAYSRTSV